MADPSPTGTLLPMVVEEWWQPLLEPDGLLLRDRALAVVDPDHVLTALRSGRLRRVQRGVYLPRRVESTPMILAHAALVSCAVPDAVVSHTTAARVHEIAVPAALKAQHVTVARHQRRRNRSDLIFHARSLQLDEVVRVGGIPTTSIARTLADLSATLDRLEAMWALDDALRRRLCHRGAIRAVIDGWHTGGGRRCVQQRLDEADGIAESILETAGRLVLRDRGVPLPVPQYQLRDRDGSIIAVLDGAYPELRVAIEFDGVGPHGQPEAIFRDRRRQNRLTELGWTVLRFTWWDVTRDPDGVAAKVLRTLARAAS